MLRLCVRAPCRDEWEPLAGERGQVSLEGVRRSGNVCSEDSFFFSPKGGMDRRFARRAERPNLINALSGSEGISFFRRGSRVGVSRVEARWRIDYGARFWAKRLSASGSAVVRWLNSDVLETCDVHVSG